MKQSALLLGFLGLLWAGSAPSATGQFIPVIIDSLMFSPPPVWLGQGAWGDYDNDGDFDLITAGNLRGLGNAEPFTQLYINDGDVITAVPNPPSPEPIPVPRTRYLDALNRDLSPLEDVWQSAVAWNDYDNDNDLDVAITGITRTGDQTLRLYENIGGANRFAPRFLFSGVRSGDISWGDHDNDGDSDLALCGTDEADQPRCILYENQVRAGGGFVPQNVGLMGLASSSIEWGDYDNDGDLDLLLIGITEPPAAHTLIYRNDGNGLFTDIQAGLAGFLFASGAWGDYDADGDLDILLSGARLTPFLLEGVIKIYRNDGGTFTDVSDGLMGSFENDPTTGRFQGAAAWGDYNNDGLLDFFVTGVQNPQNDADGKIYSTAPNDRFTKLPTDAVQEGFDGGLFGDAFWGDYDNDNDLDFFVLGSRTSGEILLEAFRNELFRRNTLPTAPTGLQASIQGTTVTLAWNPANDNQTPAPGLSYNLRLGSTPGGLDVHSPMALPETGYRLLARRGNAGHNTQWQLRGLAPGTYYWSVQAIDSSFKGSVFAQEATFTIDG